jgi:hypothetical protein
MGSDSFVGTVNGIGPDAGLSDQRKMEHATYDFNLGPILEKIDKEEKLTLVTKSLLTLKLN